MQTHDTPISRLYDLRWEVPSSKNERMTYAVTAQFDTSLLTCECAGFQFRRCCRHIRAVVAGEVGRPRAKAHAVTRPAPEPVIVAVPVAEPRPARIATTAASRRRASYLQ